MAVSTTSIDTAASRVQTMVGWTWAAAFNEE